MDPKKRKKRRGIAKEIIATERAYVDNLRFLVNDIFNPLSSFCRLGEPIVPLKELGVIFGNVGVILGLNEQLLKDLDDLKEKDDGEGDELVLGVALTMAQFAPYLKMYSAYLDNIDDALVVAAAQFESNTRSGWFSKLLSEEKDKKVTFQVFAEQIGLTKSRFEYLLTAPARRLPHYKLLLVEIRKNSKKSNPAFLEILDKAIDALELSCKHIDKSMGAYIKANAALMVARGIDKNLNSVAFAGVDFREITKATKATKPDRTLRSSKIGGSTSHLEAAFARSAVKSSQIGGYGRAGVRQSLAFDMAIHTKRGLKRTAGPRFEMMDLLSEENFDCPSRAPSRNVMPLQRNRKKALPRLSTVEEGVPKNSNDTFLETKNIGESSNIVPLEIEEVATEIAALDLNFSRNLERTLIKEGRLKKINRFGLERGRHFMLFNDVMVYGKKSKKKTISKETDFVVSAVIYLEALEIQDRYENDKSKALHLDIISPHKKFTVVFKDERTKKAWVTAIQDAIKKLVDAAVAEADRASIDLAHRKGISIVDRTRRCDAMDAQHQQTVEAARRVSRRLTVTTREGTSESSALSAESEAANKTKVNRSEREYAGETDTEEDDDGVEEEGEGNVAILEESEAVKSLRRSLARAIEEFRFEEATILREKIRAVKYIATHEGMKTLVPNGDEKRAEEEALEFIVAAGEDEKVKSAHILQVGLAAENADRETRLALAANAVDRGVRRATVWERELDVRAKEADQEAVQLQQELAAALETFDFEKAAKLRDEIAAIKTGKSDVSDLEKKKTPPPPLPGRKIRRSAWNRASAENARGPILSVAKPVLPPRQRVTAQGLLRSTSTNAMIDKKTGKAKQLDRESEAQARLLFKKLEEASKASGNHSNLHDGEVIDTASLNESSDKKKTFFSGIWGRLKI
eukprot:g3439.t1